MNVVSAIRRSAGLYPITAYWVGASLVAASLVQGWIALGTGIVILGIMAVIVILIGTGNELRRIHKMVDGQRSETLAHLTRLEQILAEHDIPLPPEDSKITEARMEDAENE